MISRERRKRIVQKAFLKKEYALTPEQVEEMKLRQRGVCPPCGKSFDDPDVKMTIDHIHDRTKRVRGLLCNHCNLAIGHAYENPEVLRNLAEYLENNGHA